MDDLEYPFEFKGSADLSRFEVSSIGQIQISKSGLTVMTIKAAVAPWNKLKLRSLRLVRIK